MLSRLTPELRSALYVGVFALVVRLGYFVIAASHGNLTATDSTDYLHLAERLMRGTGYVSAGGIFPADLNRPPGYPVFLAIANAWGHISLGRIALVQMVLGAAFSGALTYVVGRWLGRRYGIVAGGAMALDWSTVLYSPMILADQLFAILIGVGLALVVSSLVRRRTWDAILGGLVLGLATLVKPVGLVALVAVGVTVLLRPRANWRGVACLLAMGIVVLPWAVRNETRYGVFTVSTIDTVNLYFYAAEGVLHQPVLFTQVPALSDSDLSTPQFGAIRGKADQLDARLTSVAWRDIGQHLPKAVAQEMWGALHVIVGTGRETLSHSLGEQRVPSVIGTVIPLAQIIVMWLLALRGTIEAWRRRLVPRSALVLLVTVIVLMILAAGGLVGNSRFRLPVTPIICVLAAIGGVAVWEQASRDRMWRRTRSAS